MNEIFENYLSISCSRRAPALKGFLVTTEKFKIKSAGKRKVSKISLLLKFPKFSSKAKKIYDIICYNYKSYYDNVESDEI